MGNFFTGHWSNDNVSPAARHAAQEALDYLTMKKPVATRMIHVENVFGALSDLPQKIIYQQWKKIK